MNDKELIERLREHTENISNEMVPLYKTPDVCLEAADLIEQLQAKVAWMEGNTPNWGGWPWDAPYNDGYETAKAEFRKEIVAVEEQLATAQAKIAELESALMNSGLIIESLHVREVKSSRNEMVRLAAEALAQTEVK